MDRFEVSIIQYHESLPGFLESFDAGCELQRMVWEDAWGQLTRIALYRMGPDISEVGTTWLDGLVGTGAVRPFTDQEVAALGGASIFLPAFWRTISPPPWQTQVWAIPWRSDTRVIFYWRDMLEQAGVDEEGAFQTIDRVEETMARLQASGIPAPWGIWAYGRFITLQNAASWVWGAGGDFLSADGQEILLDQPEACEGLLAYCRLSRYTPPGVSQLVHLSTVDLFTTRQVAVAMGAPGWLPDLYEQSRASGTLEALGVALPPGPAFVGGSNLIVWQHTRQLQRALDLIHFLIGREMQVDYALQEGSFPVRVDMLFGPPFTTDPHRRVIVEALRSGRALPLVPKWAAVEEKLDDAIIWLWERLLQDPDQDIEGLVLPHLESVARRMAVTLGLRR